MGALNIGLVLASRPKTCMLHQELFAIPVHEEAAISDGPFFVFPRDFFCLSIESL